MITTRSLVSIVLFLLGFARTAGAAGGCDIKDFLQYVDYKGDTAVAWHLMTLQTENQSHDKEFSATGAASLFGVLNIGGQAHDVATDSSSYLKRVEADYSSKKTEALILKSLTKEGLTAYEACLKTSSAGIKAFLGSKLQDSYNVLYQWNPDANSAVPTDLVVRLVSAPKEVQTAFESRQTMWRRHVASWWTPDEDVWSKNLVPNQSGDLQVPANELAYELEFAIGRSPPERVRIPGLAETAVHYFTGREALARSCSTNPDHLEISHKYDDFHDSSRVIAVNTDTVARGEGWVFAWVNLFFQIDNGDKQLCASSTVNERGGGSSVANTGCAITVPRNSAVTVTAVAGNKKGSTEQTCLVIHD